MLKTKPVAPSFLPAFYNAPSEPLQPVSRFSYVPPPSPFENLPYVQSDSIKNFSIDFEIRAANLPAKQTGQLHVTTLD